VNFHPYSEDLAEIALLVEEKAAFKILEHAGGAKAAGPLLMGLGKPFKVLQRGSGMENVVNVVAITAEQAQELQKA
jgi:phosphotransacetylase